jgi:hypothetical protein
MTRNFSLVSPLAERESSPVINILGKRTSLRTNSLMSKTDFNITPSKTPFFKKMHIDGDFNLDKEAPITGNFNQIDYSKQFEMFEMEIEKPKKEIPILDVISEVGSQLSSEYKPNNTKRRAAKLNRKKIQEDSLSDSESEAPKKRGRKKQKDEDYISGANQKIEKLR